MHNTQQLIVDQALSFIRSKVLEPAQQSAAVSAKAKAVIKNSQMWLSHFKRVGDLLVYMNRFIDEPDTEVYRSLRAAGLLTFEDIREELVSRYSAWASERTRLDDFVVGQKYSTFDILIFCGVYDTRSGGMFIVGPVQGPRAFFVKATLSGGRYNNAWLRYPDKLKYYLKSRTVKGDPRFDETFVENRTIIQNPSVPIYAFVREVPKGDFILSGLFRNGGVHVEPNRSKWFELNSMESITTDTLTTADELSKQFAEKVRQSAKSAVQSRRARLAKAPKKPAVTKVVTTAFIRNPDVVAEVLERAGGKCEGCGLPAPFERTSDGSPYLEVHHKVQLALGGDDTVDNAVAICPNCHRNEHFGPGVLH